MFDFVDDPQGVPHPEPPVEELRGAVAAPIRTAPRGQDGDCIQPAHEIQGGVGVAVEIASVEVEIDAGAEQIPQNGGQRKLPVAGNDDIGPREGPGVFRAKGRIIPAQKDRYAGPRRPDFPDGLDDTGVPVGHHGADQHEVGPAGGLKNLPEHVRGQAVPTVALADRPERLRLRNLLAGELPATPILTLPAPGWTPWKPDRQAGIQAIDHLNLEPGTGAGVQPG